MASRGRYQYGGGKNADHKCKHVKPSLLDRIKAKEAKIKELEQGTKKGKKKEIQKLKNSKRNDEQKAREQGETHSIRDKNWKPPRRGS